MKTAVVYIHGKGGSAAEAEHYKNIFPDGEVIGFDYKSETPWEAKDEFLRFFTEMKTRFDKILLIANSIGAYLVMSSPVGRFIDKAYFISPVVDMKKLICNMMTAAGITEAELCEKSEIETNFGETLSWRYLCHARKNPSEWKVSTYVLYGENDNLTSLETISAFCEKSGAVLSVMKGGEHWFHTEKQLEFLDNWLKSFEDGCRNEI